VAGNLHLFGSYLNRVVVQQPEQRRRKKTGMLQEVRGFLANKDQNMSSLAIQWLWGISQFPRTFQSFSDLNNSSSVLRAMWRRVTANKSNSKLRCPDAHRTVSNWKLHTGNTTPLGSFQKHFTATRSSPVHCDDTRKLVKTLHSLHRHCHKTDACVREGNNDKKFWEELTRLLPLLNLKYLNLTQCS
jgi:hypothetical protein